MGFSLLNYSFEELIPFQRALKLFVSNIDTDYAKGNTEFFIGFEGSFGSKHTTPRTLTSSFLGNMVCTEGIVVRCKLIFIHINLDDIVTIHLYFIVLSTKIHKPMVSRHFVLNNKIF